MQVSGMLGGASSPFECRLMDQSVVLEAPALQLVAWLRSPLFAELVFLAQCSHLKKMTLDLLFSEDVAIAARCIEAFTAVKR
jgi:pentatricopeptide repeat domain-containing protein 1